MKGLLFLFVLVLVLVLADSTARAEPPANGDTTSVLIVAGAGGTPEYASQFETWAEQWQKAATTGGAHATLLGTPGTPPKVRDHLHELLEAEPKQGAGELWIVLLGHGTWDGREGKFNAPEDDVTISDLAGWLAPIQRPVIVVAAFSSSGAWLKPLSAPNRIVITATRAGSEENFAHFGQYLSAAIGDPKADIDHDGQVSLLEAWLTATLGVVSFYGEEGRLATEHSLLEDNGDGLGTPGDFFEGIRAVKKPKGGGVPDGFRAGQISLLRSPAEQALSPEVRARRDALELEVANLREQKGTMEEGEYYGKLEGLMLQIAKVYGTAPAK